MLKEIGEYIEQETSLVLGATLFLIERPETAPDACVVVLDRVGAVPNYMTEAQAVWPLQFLVREESGKPHSALATACTLRDLFFGKSNAGITLPVVTSGEEWFIDTCIVRSGPASIGSDAKLRPEVSLNLEFRATLNGGLP